MSLGEYERLYRTSGPTFFVLTIISLPSPAKILSTLAIVASMSIKTPEAPLTCDINVKSLVVIVVTPGFFSTLLATLLCRYLLSLSFSTSAFKEDSPFSPSFGTIALNTSQPFIVLPGTLVTLSPAFIVNSRDKILLSLSAKALALSSEISAVTSSISERTVIFPLLPILAFCTSAAKLVALQVPPDTALTTTNWLSSSLRDAFLG